ncbi:MAG: hypothetical protein JXA91_05495 [Candidatus Thermoplasmatota archaeon]|nr:hypothetical protein [Candidatus Thermoplasmatota archaeon]
MEILLRRGYNMLKKSIKIGFVLLFVFCSISFTTLSDGNSGSLAAKTLFVGGSGPGNYTKIQDAIDNASDGDTVFVYSGMYNQGHINITKSIQLIGESRDNTIISNDNISLIFLNTSNSQISNFTFVGYIIGCEPDLPDEKNIYNIEISNNKINSIVGLFIINCINVTVEGNVFSPSNCEGLFGIFSMFSKLNIEYNEISGFEAGLWIGDGSKVKNNLFRDNEVGISLQLDSTSSNPCIISKNNFIQNHIHSTFGLTYSLKISKYFSLLSKNNLIKKYMSTNIFNPTNKNLLTNIKWDGNYWDNWIGIGPKFIFGSIYLGGFFPRFFLFFRFLPMINFDWHPAKEPYNISIPQ